MSLSSRYFEKLNCPIHFDLMDTEWSRFKYPFNRGRSLKNIKRYYRRVLDYLIENGIEIDEFLSDFDSWKFDIFNNFPEIDRSFYVSDDYEFMIDYMEVAKEVIRRQ